RGSNRIVRRCAGLEGRGLFIGRVRKDEPDRLKEGHERCDDEGTPAKQREEASPRHLASVLDESPSADHGCTLRKPVLRVELLLLPCYSSTQPHAHRTLLHRLEGGRRTRRRGGRHLAGPTAVLYLGPPRAFGGGLSAVDGPNDVGDAEHGPVGSACRRSAAARGRWAAESPRADRAPASPSDRFANRAACDS